MLDDTKHDDGTQQDPERRPVTIIGPVARIVSMPDAGLTVLACPYGTPGQRCYECPLVSDLPCLVREMIGADDETTRSLARRLLGGR